MSWNTIQDLRPNVLRNMQNKKDMRLESHTRRSQRHGSRKKLPKVSLSGNDESCRAKNAWNLPSNSCDECGLIHPRDLPMSFWPCVLSGFLLNCMNCYVFVLNNIFILPWYFDFPFCPILFFFFTVYRNVRVESLNKMLTFIHLYRVLFLVSSIAHSRWFQHLNTPTLGRVAKASPFQKVFTRVPS